MDYLRLKQVNLTNFRLHQSFSCQLSPKKNLIVGPNASGKTALIEAIYLSSTGDSFRAGKIEEMISFGQELARVQTRLGLANANQNQQTTLEVMLTRGLVQGRKTQYRLFSINEIKKRKKDFVRQFQVVLFRPEDMRLIEGSPSRRRGFLNQVLTQLFYEYQASLKTYENTLKRRNRLLLAIREKEQPKSVLKFWDLSLLKNGQIIQDYRRQFLTYLNQINSPLNYQVKYLPKIISPEKLTKYLNREIAAGHSLIGPHKDDFEVEFLEDTSKKWLSVATYGSRGQQRLAVLWLKAGEGRYREKNTTQEVVWLLDDIFSELDEASRKQVLDLIKQRQSLVTSTSHKVANLIKADKVIQLSS